MTYVRIDDDILDHPRMQSLRGNDFAVYVAALAWCGHYLTDGVIPRASVDSIARRLQINRDRTTVHRRLIAAGLFIERGDDYEIRDYLDRQKSRSQVERLREHDRDRKRIPAGIRSGIQLPDTDAASTTKRTLAEPTSSAPAKEAAKSPRLPNALFDAVVSACGIDIEQLTKTARGSLNGALRELREVGAQPSDVRAKARAYRIAYPNATLTPLALAKWWPSLGTAAAPSSVSSAESMNPAHVAERRRREEAS